MSIISGHGFNIYCPIAFKKLFPVINSSNQLQVFQFFAFKNKN